MLEFLKVKNPEHIKSLLKADSPLYNPLKDTWIVSDLKSKQEIQAEAIQKNSFYTDEAILRVSDFWRLWIRRIEPTLQVVSSDFIKSLVQSFVDTHGAKLEIIDSEVSTLNKAVQEFAPILLHPGSDDVLQDWLAMQPSEKKWRRWYQLSKICINYIVYNKRALDSKWSAAYLQTLDMNLLSWNRKLFVELGSELSTVEMGLFKHISQTQDVVIITPDPEWKDKFPYLLNTYKENFGYGAVKEILSESKYFNPQKKQFIRLSTQLAEVKFAVAKIRGWAEDGISLDKITIISADIEKYWPVLQYYLDEEGLAYAKDSVAQLGGLGDVQNLMAALKNVSQDVAWDSLEKSFFSKESDVQYKFEQFKALFYQLYDEDDLNRDHKIKNLFYKKIDFNAEFDRDEFLSYMVKTWIGLPQTENRSNSNSDIFEIVFKDFLAQSLNVKIKFSRWVQFLKNRLSHKEITTQKSKAGGLSVLPLMSAQMISATHRIYIGLNDEYYHKKQNSLMSLSDSVTLKTQFDLAVDYSEESYLDFNLRWQIMSCSENYFFTSAHLSFTSEPLNSSLFFIENSPQSDLVEPARTRVDELQKQLAHVESFSQIKNLTESVSTERLIHDMQGYESTIKTDIFRMLSVSDIENYAQCSFKLLASKGFRLRELPQVALDLDPRHKGSFVHALFECCIQLMLQNEYSTDKVSEFLDLKRIEFKIFLQQEEHWKIQKNKFLLLAQKFYQFEQLRIKSFTSETEKSVEMYFDLDQQKFTAQKPENYFVFSLRLDRIDTHKTKKYCVIYDYKSSSYQVSNFSSWLTEQQFQMLLYIMALELTNKSDNPVKAALYYQYKTFDLKKGLIDENIALSDFSLSKRNKSLINVDKITELKENFVTQIAAVLKQLGADEFNTRPSNLDLCKTCDWRKLCRATHLM